MATPPPPAPKAPKFPDPRSPGGCVDYLLAFWKILGGEGPAPEATAKRIGEAKTERTAQAAIARAIYLGPAPAQAGAERWLKVAINLQKYVERMAGERPIASKLGGALADVAGAVQHVASSAASSATGAAKTAAIAVAAKAAELSTAVIPTPGDLVSSVLEIPGSLARRTADAIGQVVPGAGTALKVVLGLGAAGVGGVGLVGLIAYVAILGLSVYGGFYLAPKWALKTLRGVFK